MTAHSPSTILARAAVSRWRATWAVRENARRRRAFDSATAAWHRRNDHLVRLRIEAAGFHGYAHPRESLPMDLGRDEVVYRVLPTTELVEAGARHSAGLPTPELTVTVPGAHPPRRGLPTGLRVVDAGMAVVTNHRVVFSGGESCREWTYANMVGPAHHPDVPLTLLHTADGSPLAGLRVPATATLNFRFYLTLAFAAATGQRAAVAAQVDALLAGHRHTRPTPPAPADPARAPLTAVRPNRPAIAAVVGALTFATLSAGTPATEQAGPSYRAALGASSTDGTDAPAAERGTTPSTPATPEAPDSAPAPSPTGPATTVPPDGNTLRVVGPMPRRPRTAGAAAAAGDAPTDRVDRPAPSTVPAPTPRRPRR
ncbi:hypothetical protein [Micromonospora purpureochromogenes]|uniref:Uncharacterized protein n=1 Tax=Micromonospora purpureochromogenes TaxID=47872 RepID=A0ABX2RRX4_9ACTN|nr:hypothetical protein [Micromonospora purpureochromogenes]NYF59283.1 hypothetical protein [Micromonospora purpureochromogenes]